MKKALLVVQGINKDPDYFYENVVQVPNIKTQYDEVFNVPIETIWDKAWFNRIPFLGNNWVSQVAGDVWQFYKQDKKRKAACRLVRKTILDLQKKGYVVDLMGHSLGCQLILCAGPQKSRAKILKVRNIFLLASPLGFFLNLFRPFNLRTKVKEHTDKFNSNLIAKKIVALFSTRDKVSQKFLKDKEVKRIVQQNSINKVDVYKTSTSHNDREYLDFLADLDLDIIKQE